MANKKTHEQLQLEMKAAIDSLGCVEVVRVSSRRGDMRVMCRCSDKRKWLTIVHEYESRKKNESFYSFIGQKYFVQNKNLTAAWVIMVDGDDLDTAVQRVRQLLLESAEAVRGRVERRRTTPGTPRRGEPKEYTTPLPFKTGFGDKIQARVSPLTSGN